MYTLIEQITNNNMTTADVIAKNDSVIALHRQMVATYNIDENNRIISRKALL